MLIIYRSNSGVDLKLSDVHQRVLRPRWHDISVEFDFVRTTIWPLPQIGPKYSQSLLLSSWSC